MNQRLLEAARAGDVDYLLKEMDTNPSMLDAVTLQGAENPLHTTCLAGHLNFAATVVKLRPQFCWELNQDGFIPLHAAASCGHGEIVKELLKVDLSLCLIEGKDGKIPLHLAVVKGNVEVVRELLSASPDSIDCTTAHGETSLHLAVKNNQFQTFKVLTQHLKQVNKEDLLNSKDLHGNTILHLAVFRKQYQVVDFLLNGQVTSKEKIEFNSLNESGFTPLDMLLTCPSEAGNYEIADLLIQGGALKAKNLLSPAFTQERQNHHESDARHEQPGSPANNIFAYFKYNSLNESPSNVRNTLLVIVILITAATFQSVLTPPGGTWQDDLVLVPSTVNNSSTSATNNTTATKPHTAGQAILLTKDPQLFRAFIIGNSLGFHTSLYMILVLTQKFPMRFELQVLLIAILGTYNGCVTAISPDLITMAFLFISVVLVIIIAITTILLRNCLGRRRNASANTSQGNV